jgi:predicted DNA-binding transcriptional regulator YafY
MAFIDEEIRKGMRRQCLVSTTDLANEYEVSSKTIQRDIEYMRCILEAPLEYDQQRHGWYYTEDSFRLQHFQLSESDLFAICIAEQALAQYKNSPIYEKLQTIFNKITASLPPKATTIVPKLFSEVTMASFPATGMDGETWQAVFDALKEKRKVSIHYQKPGDKKPEWRTIAPYHAVNYHGAWYVLGFCHKRDAVRIFNLSRIKQAKVTKEEFVVQDDFDPKELLEKSFDMYVGGDTKRVQIKFSPIAAPYIRERNWHPTQKLDLKNDGSLIFSAEVNNLTGMIPWIFSWGPNARILEPQELIDQFCKDLKGLVANYSDQ